MCMGSSKAAKQAAAAQTAALNKMAAAQKAKTTDMVSKTNATVKTNDNAQKRNIYSLRIPLNGDKSLLGGSLGNSYGLNIPL